MLYKDQRFVKVATCTLNQWAMDFEGNKQRIIASLRKAKDENANIRIGPELEITGYGCEDHFLEEDTLIHSWEVLVDIIIEEDNFTENMLCDFGMPVVHKGIIFNCRILVYNKKIILIRPKIVLSDDGNYKESRYFTAWSKYLESVDTFILPKFVANRLEQTTCSFGVCIIAYRDVSYTPQMWEELWVPYSPAINFSNEGCEIIGNSSACHFQIAKHKRRYDLIVESSKKNGGLYIYSNLVGCDGGRLYFDGGSFIILNGKILEQGQRFFFDDIEVVFGIADLNEIVSYRGSIKSRCVQAEKRANVLKKIVIEENLLNNNHLTFNPFFQTEPRIYTFDIEMSYAPACWLWDYLRRSGASGFFLPLSGGADSGCVAVMVSVLTKLLYKEISVNKNEFVLNELRRIMKMSDYTPRSAQEICNYILVTSYMETKQSTSKTKSQANAFAKEIGACHFEINIDSIIELFIETIGESLGKKPQFICNGGDIAQDLAIQNLQARVRMVMGYMIATLAEWVRDRKGFLLVLSSSNLDELICGYVTKYDNSSGDLNPIGSISKIKLNKFLLYCKKEFNYESLDPIINQSPSAELRPHKEGYKPQTDEEDIGLTYEELNFMAMLRKDFKCGPYSMFRKLLYVWTEKKPIEVMNKVKLLFKKYGTNRHKAAVITPCLHCESYSVDESRFDLRQILYNNKWTFQFNQIEEFMKSNNALHI